MIRKIGQVDFIMIEVFGCTLVLTEYSNMKEKSRRSLDLIGNEASKTLFTTLMKHNEDLPIVISWKDLRFLRKIGIRI